MDIHFQNFFLTAHLHARTHTCCMHCCCIIFFYQLTALLVIVLLKAIAEAVSDNRELTRIFHQIISSDFKVIASVLLDISTPHQYANIFY